MDPITQMANLAKSTYAAGDSLSKEDVLSLVAVLEATNYRAGLLAAKLEAIHEVHAEEQFGDCVEDGDPYPCRTIQVLNWLPAGPQPKAQEQPEEKN